MPNHKPRSGSVLIILLVVGIVTCSFNYICSLIRTQPFSTAQDSLIYTLPSIKLHSDELLTGHLPRMFWQIGAGWTPVESGQVGVAYPIYWISNLVTRLAGRPLLLLEFSAILHLIMAGMFVWCLLPRWVHRRERITWTLSALFPPTAIILGMNAHSWIADYPWFLLCALLLMRAMRPGQTCGWKHDVAMVLACAGYYSTAHPQMYVFGMAFLSLWVFAWAQRNRRTKALATLALAQLPLLAHIWFLRWTFSHAHPNWTAQRADPQILLLQGQTLSTVLTGLFCGNLAGKADFAMWPNVSKEGIGMFFAPLFMFVLIGSIRKRRWTWLVVLVVTIMLISIRTFPFLAATGLGPFMQFRWTWKLAAFVGPLTLVTVAGLLPRFLAQRRQRMFVITAAAVLSAVVCARGVRFNLMPMSEPMAQLGVEGIVRETQKALRSAGVPTGSRIALITRVVQSDKWPSVPYLGLIGSAPVLAGYETAHTYEPMESEAVARSHASLSTPWRITYTADEYRANHVGIDRQFGDLGVAAVISPVDVFEGRAVQVLDCLGRSTFVLRLERHGLPTWPWPWGFSGEKPVEIKRLPGGLLETAVPLDRPPAMTTARPIRWERLASGRWQGTPVLLPAGLLWIELSLVLATALVIWTRHRQATFGEHA